MRRISQKGISEIIAVIMMLMITIGLAGTAFVYIQSALLGRTQQQIVISDVSCSSSTSTIYITVKNLDPQLDIAPSGDLLVRLNNVPITAITWSPDPIAPNTNSVGIHTCTPGVCVSGTILPVKVIGPSNTLEAQAIC